MIEAQASSKRRRSRHFSSQVDGDLIWRVVIWGQVLVFFLVILTINIQNWELSYAYVFNIVLAIFLIVLLVVGLAFLPRVSSDIDHASVINIVLFLLGCLVITYGIFIYQSSGSSENFLLIITLGILLAFYSVGLMVLRRRRTSRSTGYYSMWLFGMLLILFMPFNELDILNYSERDILMGYLGLAISLMGSIAFVIEYNQGLKIKDWMTVGDAKYISSKFDESIEYYDKILSLDKQNDQIWSFKGTALLRLGLSPQALECFEVAIEINPSSFIALSGKALALNNLKRYSEALDYHDLAIDVYNTAVGWNNKGNTLVRMGADPEEALFCYEKALEMDPDYEIAWFNKGKSEINLELFRSAARSFSMVVNIKPDFSEAWFQRGKALAATGDVEKALFCYDMTIQLNPSFTDAWNERKILLVSKGRKKIKPIPIANIHSKHGIFGPSQRVRGLLPDSNLPETYERMDVDRIRQDAFHFASEGNYDSAIRLLDSAIAKNPDDPVNYITKGIFLSRLEQLDEALESFHKAIELKPEWVGPWFSCGMVLASKGDYSSALESLDKAIELSSTYADAWSVKGIIHGTMREYEKAIDCFDRVLELRSDDIEAWRSKGLALNKLGRYEEAIRSFENIIKFDPDLDEAYRLLEKEKVLLDDARTFFNFGVILAKSKIYDKALEQLAEAIILRPNHIDALYMTGIVYGVIGKYDLAKEYFERVLELNQNHIEALYGKGNILIKEEQFLIALEVLNQVLELNDSHVDAQCDRGVALFKLGKVEEAVRSLDGALKNAGDHGRSIKLREECVRILKERDSGSGKAG